MREHEIEPIRGLPEQLPEGERILWQGEPSWRVLARQAFHLPSLTLYFSALVVLRGASLLFEGAGVAGALFASLEVVPLALVALGIVALLAYVMARATVFTVTNRRVVMRFGVALPMAINLPFKQIESAAVRTFSNGHGDLPLVLAADCHLAYLHLWPFARPWRFDHPEPMLRAIPEAGRVAEILAEALAADGYAPRRPSPANAQGSRGQLATCCH